MAFEITTSSYRLERRRGAPVKEAVRAGLFAGAGAAFFGLIGAQVAMDERFIVAGLLTLSQAVLIALAIAAGFFGGSPAKRGDDAARTLTRGAIAGLTAGLVLGALVLLIANVNLRGYLVAAGPQLMRAWSFGASPGSGGAWAEVAGVAHLSDVALLNRLRGAAGWLGEIVGALLTERLSGTAASADGDRLRLIDATTLSHRGSRQTDWRLHVCCRLGPRPQIEQVELSDGHGSESLRRFARAPGDIEIGDRGYARAADLAAVVEVGGDFIVRTGWGSVGLRRPDGTPFDLFAALDRLPEHGIAEVAAAVTLKRAGTPLLPVRLVMLRLPEAAAERNRGRARRRAASKARRCRRRPCAPPPSCC